MTIAILASFGSSSIASFVAMRSAATDASDLFYCHADLSYLDASKSEAVGWSRANGASSL